MTLNESLIAELKHEAANTRKMLEKIPAEHFDYQPHEKSMSLKSLSTHMADLFGWTAYVLLTDQLDFQNNDLKRPEINSTQDLLDHLEMQVNASVAALTNAEESLFEKNWVLRNGDYIIMDLPRATVIRGTCMSHIYHHRGQLSVYLRLLDIPIPGMYGPSADEM